MYVIYNYLIKGCCFMKYSILIYIVRLHLGAIFYAKIMTVRNL